MKLWYLNAWNSKKLIKNHDIYWKTIIIITNSNHKLFTNVLIISNNCDLHHKCAEQSYIGEVMVAHSLKISWKWPKNPVIFINISAASSVQLNSCLPHFKSAHVSMICTMKYGERSWFDEVMVVRNLKIQEIGLKNHLKLTNCSNQSAKRL